MPTSKMPEGIKNAIDRERSIRGKLSLIFAFLNHERDYDYFPGANSLRKLIKVLKSSPEGKIAVMEVTPGMIIGGELRGCIKDARFLGPALNLTKIFSQLGIFWNLVNGSDPHCIFTPEEINWEIIISEWEEITPEKLYLVIKV